MSDTTNALTDRSFEYLLNAMEHAGHSAYPAREGYKTKREAVFAYVADLQARAALARPADAGVVEAARAVVDDYTHGRDKELLESMNTLQTVLMDHAPKVDRAAIIEECAKVCEEPVPFFSHPNSYALHALHIRDKIRALAHREAQSADADALDPRGMAMWDEVERHVRAGGTLPFPAPVTDWNDIASLNLADDLVWLAQIKTSGEMSIDGPRAAESDDYDRYTHWMPCNPPPRLAAQSPSLPGAK